MAELNCRFCSNELEHTFVNLGMSPIANDMLKSEHLNCMEPFYPLHVYVCEKCFLVQLPEHQSPTEIFSDYTYFSSYSESWLNHAKKYVQLMMDRFLFGKDSLVVELASNDGYLLQYFKEKGVPVLGVEPAENVAKVAIEKSIPTIAKFFGTETARSLVSDNKKADLIIGNNVLAHVPDINDFVAGIKVLLATEGVITVEFPHLVKLMELNQFDTIYHEHFSYLSLTIVKNIFQHHGLKVFDVQQLKTHGGSLRVFATHVDNETCSVSNSVTSLLETEAKDGYTNLAHYTGYQDKVNSTKRHLLEFLIREKEQGKSIVAYGAPAKGNTLLNYCGIRSDFIDYTVDKSPHKQGKYLPGTHLPVHHPDMIFETQPDYILILPWNLRKEIAGQLEGIRQWQGQFIVPIPRLEIF